jgi:hypothetical protein
MPKKFYEIDSLGLYYKHVTIVNDDSTLIGEARVVIYDGNMFKIQATGRRI